MPVQQWQRIAVVAVLGAWPALAQQTAPPDYQLIRKWTIEKLPTEEVARLEKSVEQNPEDLASRTRLMFAYLAEPNNPLRAKHTLWMIEHHPELEVLQRGMFLFREPGPLGDNASYNRAAELWEQQATLHNTDSRVVINAARFLRGYYFGQDPVQAEKWMTRARKLEPADQGLLTELSGLYAVGLIQALRPEATAATRSYAAGVRLALEKSDDAALIWQTGRQLQGAGMLGPEVTEESRKLQARGIAMGYKPPESMTRPLPTMPPPATRQVDNGPQPVHRVEPVYPPAALTAKVEGTVRLRVLVAVTGAVQQIDPITGHSLLVKAAVEAVRQWKYAPQSLPALVEIELPFRLPR